MNAGFSSLAYLKTQLLAEALRDGTNYDAALLQLGLGVASAMENYCGRKFARAVDAYFVCTADREHCYVDRYPIESVAAIALKSGVVGFVDQSLAMIVNTNNDSGAVFFGAPVGPYWSQLRIKYTGGYWWDTTEEATDTLPAGATAIPEDLRLAWVLQCKEVWNQNDKLGTGMVAPVDKTPTFKALDWIPQVKATLDGFVRYQLT